MHPSYTYSNNLFIVPLTAAQNVIQFTAVVMTLHVLKFCQYHEGSAHTKLLHRVRFGSAETVRPRSDVTGCPD